MKNGKRNGKGIEFNNLGQLIFKGIYSDEQKMEGYYKEFFLNNQLEFEGEYLHGKKNGKGKEYFCTGILKFEGEYLDGERNGKGKEYNNKGELIFEGQFSKGKRIENSN